MGEYADNALENMEFSANLMRRPRAKNRKTCKHCGQRNLRWRAVGESFRLFDNRLNEFHNCSETYDHIAAKAAVATADDFDDLTKEN